MNQKGYCVDSNLPFQDHHSLLFIRNLSAVISTTLMFFMTKVKSRRFTKNVGRVNIMLFLYTIFDIYNPYGIKLLIRLRLGLSHLNERKFKHGFKEIINPICICGGATESKIISFSTVLNTVKQGKPPLTTFKASIKCY